MDLQKRTFTTCSNEEIKKLELAKVEKDLRNNGCPRKLINKCERNISKPRFQSDISNNQKVIVTAPYFAGVAERVSKLLKKHNINVYSKNSNSLRDRMCKFEDKKNPKHKKFVVYELKCIEEHCNVKYNGESGRTAGLGMMAHMKTVKNEEATFSNITENQRGHRFNFNRCKILATKNRV